MRLTRLVPVQYISASANGLYQHQAAMLTMQLRLLQSKHVLHKGFEMNSVYLAFIVDSIAQENKVTELEVFFEMLLEKNESYFKFNLLHMDLNKCASLILTLLKTMLHPLKTMKIAN